MDLLFSLERYLGGTPSTSNGNRPPCCTHLKNRQYRMTYDDTHTHFSHVDASKLCFELLIHMSILALASFIFELYTIWWQFLVTIATSKFLISDPYHKVATVVVWLRLYGVYTWWWRRLEWRHWGGDWRQLEGLSILGTLLQSIDI